MLTLPKVKSQLHCWRLFPYSQAACGRPGAKRWGITELSVLTAAEAIQSQSFWDGLTPREGSLRICTVLTFTWGVGWLRPFQPFSPLHVYIFLVLSSNSAGRYKSLSLGMLHGGHPWLFSVSSTIRLWGWGQGQWRHVEFSFSVQNPQWRILLKWGIWT